MGLAIVDVDGVEKTKSVKRLEKRAIKAASRAAKIERRQARAIPENASTNKVLAADLIPDPISTDEASFNDFVGDIIPINPASLKGLIGIDLIANGETDILISTQASVVNDLASPNDDPAVKLTERDFEKAARKRAKAEKKPSEKTDRKLASIGKKTAESIVHVFTEAVAATKRPNNHEDALSPFKNKAHKSKKSRPSS